MSASDHKVQLAELYELSKELLEKSRELEKRLARLPPPERLWLLLTLPVRDLCAEQIRVSLFIRAQFEELLFDGDPFYTGLPPGLERLQAQHEAFKERIRWRSRQRVLINPLPGD